jgi:hypothetical protein
MTDLTPEVREKLQEILDTCPKSWRPTSNTPSYFGIYDKKKGEPQGKALGGSACHAALSYYCRNECSVVINGHHPGFMGTYPELTLWIARESPYSRAVLNKDNTDEILNRGSLIDVEEVGVGGALWLCKAWRHTIEDSWKPGFWNQLRAEGLDGLQAFIGADILDDGGLPYHGTTHVALFGYCNPTALRGFYEEIKKGEKNPTSQAARQKHEPNRFNWGSLAGKKVKMADGWGGFTEVQKPGDAKIYAQALKEIFEGDPNNVIK